MCTIDMSIQRGNCQFREKSFFACDIISRKLEVTKFRVVMESLQLYHKFMLFTFISRISVLSIYGVYLFHKITSDSSKTGPF